MRSRGRPTPARAGRIRVAFYGRTSTTDYQDEASSRRWQLDNATDLIGDRGLIVAEFFDVGWSRKVPWSLRPEPSRLLAEIAQVDRPFDAVVVGEYERAFEGGQLQALLPVLRRHGVVLWLPEFGDVVDEADPVHQAVSLLLGCESRREVLRARFRSTAAMRAQARDQGRHLGGRPPYGYRLVDGGPHPNRAHARWGRRQHRLGPDPVSAPVVRWIFARRLAGGSAAATARALNECGVRSPSGHDPERNRHRSRPGVGRFTRWPKSSRIRDTRVGRCGIGSAPTTNETRPGDKRSSRGAIRRWNPKDEWVISTWIVHPPLVSETDFIRAQSDPGATAGGPRCPLCSQ
ncbi:hypothetical protein Vau01_115580 [Virgisporangium aurantiacum]|uniref:Recombinase domain-containing protein n=1 Tax=Virgisporangium aurantiacum TaxID=175570 RepID=A0A8J3ZJE4_9ACTN|nr:hypothetical protein Vau01_115580 [Virgisporangium aurantiacum]